jgi:hypothetical protein
MTVAQLRLIIEDLCTRGYQGSNVKVEGWNESGDLVSFHLKGDAKKGTDPVGRPEIILR